MQIVPSQETSVKKNNSVAFPTGGSERPRNGCSADFKPAPETVCELNFCGQAIETKSMRRVGVPSWNEEYVPSPEEQLKAPRFIARCELQNTPPRRDE